MKGANAGKFVSRTMSEMAGEEALELELEREMVSVHRANLGGSGGGELAWVLGPPRVSLDRDWQCFNMMGGHLSPGTLQWRLCRHWVR